MIRVDPNISDWSIENVLCWICILPLLKSYYLKSRKKIPLGRIIPSWDISCKLHSDCGACFLAKYLNLFVKVSLPAERCFHYACDLQPSEVVEWTNSTIKKKVKWQNWWTLLLVPLNLRPVPFGKYQWFYNITTGHPMKMTKEPYEPSLLKGDRAKYDNKVLVVVTKISVLVRVFPPWAPGTGSAAEQQLTLVISVKWKKYHIKDSLQHGWEGPDQVRPLSHFLCWKLQEING